MRHTQPMGTGRWLVLWSLVAILGILVVAGVSGGLGLVLHLVVTDARGTPTPERQAVAGLAVASLLAAGGTVGVRDQFTEYPEGWPSIAAFTLAAVLAFGLYAEDGIRLARRGAVLAGIGGGAALAAVALRRGR